MKVLFLGGAGAVGKAAALASVNMPQISRITIADINRELVEKRQSSYK